MKEDRLFVTALARGLEVLRCFTPETPELGTTEIARMIGLPQPTVWRLCYTLSQLGYLVPGRNADRLRVGAGVLTLGHASITHAGVAEFAYPAMKALADRFEASISLAEPDRQSMVIVQRAEGPAILKLNLHVGSRLPIANSSLGWAYLAALPVHERSRVIADVRIHTSEAEWETRQKDIAAAVSQYEANGFVFNLCQSHRDINAIGVPVVALDGKRILALTCGGSSSYMTRDILGGSIATAMKVLAREIAPILVGDAPMSARNGSF